MPGILLRLAPLVMLAGFAACTEPTPDVTPASIVVSPAGVTTVASGASLTLRAMVSNAGGTSLAEATVQWTSDDVNIATVSPQGIVTGVHAGQTQVTATTGSVHSPPVSITTTPGAATQLGIRTQPSGGMSGLPLKTQPVVEVRDAAGNIVTSSSVIVTATILQGGGALTGSTAAAVNGVATFTDLAVFGSLGDRTMAFSVADLTSATSSGFAVEAGAPAQLIIRTQPTGVASGSPFGTVPVIEVRDEAGNLATSSTIPVTATIANGGGALVNATAIPIAGIATFTDLTLNGLTGNRALIFSTPGLPVAISASFTLVPGKAVALRIRRQPSGAQASGLLAVQPIIEITDSGGNIATSSAAVVTAQAAACNATVAGGASVSAANGVASFSSLSVSGTIGQCTLAFSSTGLVMVTSATFALVPGPPVTMRITTQPGGASLAGPLTVQPVVALYDAADNLATNYSGTVTATIASGSGTVSNGFAQVVNGIASFQSLRVSGPTGNVTLLFQAGSASAISNALTLVGAPATRLRVRTYAGTSRNGLPMVPSPVVEVLDAAGNIVFVAVTITMTTDAVSGTITNGTATSVNGVATFNNLILSGPLGGRDYTFSSPGLSSPFPVRIDIVP